MTKIIDKNYQRMLLAIFSGLLLYACIWMNDVFRLLFVSIAFVPFFMAINKQNKKTSLLLGFLFGFSNGLMMAYPVIGMASDYFESGGMVGFFAYLSLAVAFAIWPALFSWAYAALKISHKPISVFSFLLVGALWVSIDFINCTLLPSFPWTNNFAGYYISTFPMLIQIAKFTGVFGVSFFIILINYGFYTVLLQQKAKLLLVPLTIILFQFGFGYLMMIDTSDSSGKIKVSILLDNLPTDLRWDENINDSIIEKHFLSPNREAAANHPNLIVWTETAFPWKLSLDDDLLYEILKITYPAQAGHIVGIWTDGTGSENAKFNSALYLHPDGRITSKYDKMFPLAILESPLFETQQNNSSILNASFNETAKGSGPNILKTPFGNAGMIICNETSLPSHARNAVNEGAQFFTVMSNDAWASEYKTILQARFLGAIMRAVECGRDVIVASNMGYSGFISSNGKVIKMESSDKPGSLTSEITKNKKLTFYASHGDLFSIVCLLVIFIGFVLLFVQSRK